MSFSQFGLSEPILRSVELQGYDTPTPIQTQAIPTVMAGRDLLGIAQTGTGKTAAFALPMLQMLGDRPASRRRRSCRSLVLSPTRELASQIAESFRTYGHYLRLTTTVVYGGVPLGRQERALAEGVDVLVATPGRLLDLVDRRAVSLGDVEIFVLDEADQMLDLGFIHALKRIESLIPKKRQTLFFSATMPNLIAGLADRFLRDPVKVAVTPVATTAERVEQNVIFAPTGDKQAVLRAVLDDPKVDRALVFTRTKHGADRVVRNLDRDGIPAAAIHGNKSQGQRERALADFKAGRCRVLIATDIAARGIDVEAVSHVINFDLPNVAETYVHRIGRTARAGAAGIAVALCSEEERGLLRDIEKLTRMRIPVAELPAGFARAKAASRQAEAQAPREERRPAPNGQADGRRQGASRGQDRPGSAGRPGQPARRQSNRGPKQGGRPGEKPAGSDANGRRAASRPEMSPRAASDTEGRLAWLDRARFGQRS